MTKNETQRPAARGIASAAALAAALAAPQALAIDFQKGELTGSWDTTVSYGLSMRVEERDEDLVGKANLNPNVGQLSLLEQIAAPGRFSVNNDDGNLNFDQGDLISNALSLTTELGFEYGSFGGFFRGNAFYDFKLENKDELSDRAKELVGSRARLLDAYLYYDFDVAGRFGSIRVGRQVVNWGESTFIQQGLNVVNPVDLGQLRQAGSQLRDAFLPVNMAWASIDLDENMSLEALYMFEFEEIEPDPAGTFFSTSDIATPGAEFAMLGFGLFDERTPGLTIPRGPTKFASDDGQFGVALRYFAPNLGFTEFGFYYLNYHSRLPLISGTSVTGPSPESGVYRVEYPENIDLFGWSWNTTLGGSGIAFSGEVSFRPDQPYQVDDVELLFAALTPLNSGIPNPANRFQSQLGTFDFGESIEGFDRLKVTQAQFTLSKLFGPGNPFGANEWLVLGEVGATEVWDLPDREDLRFNGPGTDTGGGADARSGDLRNPLTQEKGFATGFSWGYRLLTRATYNSAFGTAWDVTPSLAFNHDVEGTTPGPGGNFVEGRKRLTVGVTGNYLERWSVETSYTAFFGAVPFNLLADRDFVSFSISYSF